MPWLNACLCQHEKKQRPSISPPIHLLLKPEADSQSHTFRTKAFKRPRPCNVCHQPVHHQGSCCRVCKFVCHKACENKDLARSRFADAALEIHRQWHYKRIETFPTVAAAMGVIVPSAPSTPSVTPQPRDEDTPEPLHTYDAAQRSGTKNRHGGGSSGHTHSSRGVGTPGSISGCSTAASSVAGSRRGRASRDVMDLCYVTERIIAMWVPGDVSAAAYSKGQQQAARMLQTKHGNNYMVFNVSEPRRAARSHHERVRELGWPAELAPPLERLCTVCKDIDSWLSGNPQRIAVIHARGSKERIGVIIEAYMHYSSICGSADQALDRFAMRRYLDDKIGDLDQPSHKRYVEYFSGLLSGNIRINSAPLYLTHVTVLGAPIFDATPVGGCRAFLKLYEGLVPVYTSGVHTVSAGTRQFTVNVAAERGRRGLQLRGDILLKCYHRNYGAGSGDSPTRSVTPMSGASGVGGAADRPHRELIFACQFHTCAVTDYTLTFTRQHLDKACNDLRFPLDGAVELHFSTTPESRHPSPAPTPAVPVDSSDDPVTKWDSYEHLGPASAESLDDSDTEDTNDGDEVNHTYGPLDGSIYATILKKQQQQQQLQQQHQQQQQQKHQEETLQKQLSHHQQHHQPVVQHQVSSSGGGVIGSPHTVSMDSGISSAGNGLLHKDSRGAGKDGSAAATGGGSSMGAPLDGGPSAAERRRALDELLHDMLLTVESIPDPAPASIPYHARVDSQPFSYTPDAMLQVHPGLASPSLVRKASFKNKGPPPPRRTSNPSSPECAEREINSPTRDYLLDNGSSSASPRSPEFHDGTVVGGGTLTWLQRQQQKLRERREVQLRHERYPHETRLFSELRTLQYQHHPNNHNHHHHQHHHHPGTRISASHRDGGYTSDTTHLADDDDEDDLAVPLHVHTVATTSPTHHHKPGSAPASPHLPHRRRLQNGHVSSTMPRNHVADERPFVAVKRAHEQHRKYLEQSQLQQSPPSSPHQPPPPPPPLTFHQPPPTTRSSQPPPPPLSPPSETDSTCSPVAAASEVASGLLSMVEEMRQHRQEQEHDRLSSLMASLAATSSQGSTSSTWQPQLRDESFSSWRSASTSEPERAGESPPRSSSPRPQTPAFPVHPRTPYANNSHQQQHFEHFTTTTTTTNTSTGGLPPKSPTTQRRGISSSSNKALRKWPSNSSVSSKDRSPSPVNDFGGSSTPQTPSTPGRTFDHYNQSPKSGPFNGLNGNAGGGQSSPTVYYGQSRRSSVHSNSEPPQDVSPAHVKFVRDTSRFWYMPTITREEAINMLRDQPPGAFVVRDSNSFPGAFGLALKVVSPPHGQSGSSPGISMGRSGDPGSELVRHFLIEPTSRGVRLKGCPNEPVFSCLSALVYQHSLMPMALPSKLVLPEGDTSRLGPDSPSAVTTAQMLLQQGAACNVLYLYTMDTESLTGPQAVRKTVAHMFHNRPLPQAVVVHFKVSGQGITLTDNKRQLFFRRHYPVTNISYCGLDPEDNRWSQKSEETGLPISSNRVFGFIARKQASKSDNQCHLFAELEPEQPASAIVNFVSKVMMGGHSFKANIV